jgi:hypothetical protein
MLLKLTNTGIYVAIGTLLVPVLVDLTGTSWMYTTCDEVFSGFVGRLVGNVVLEEIVAFFLPEGGGRAA